MTFTFAAAVAENYWGHRGALIMCKPRLELLTDAETASWGFTPDMVTDEPGCTVGITPWADSWRTDRDNDWLYCREVVHEVGHLAGFDHGYGGVMDPDANVVPWGCDHPWKFLRRHAELTQTWRSGG